jgi:hypothetical protein
MAARFSGRINQIATTAALRWNEKFSVYTNILDRIAKILTSVMPYGRCNRKLAEKHVP